MIYVFGDYEFDTWRHELRLAGAPLHVEPKAFDLLALLLQRHNQFVSREELFRHLWPDQFVSDDALVYCVAEARRAVGDSGRVQRVIKTIRGRGYCFIAPVVARLPADSPAEATTAAPVPLPSQGAAATERIEGVLGQEALAAERRQLTVLWCRGVTSPVPSSEPLDPEVHLQVVQEAQHVCDQAVRRFEGYMAQHFGNGFVVYFGYPHAHEDDARRAVHTGLEIVQGMQRLAPHLKRQQAVECAMQIGIHTGLVVMGAVGSGERRTQLALGETPQLAAQLAGLAAPNTVVISPATLRLIEGYFVCHALGVHTLDDPAEPLAVSQVLQESAAQGRLDAAMATGLTPFVVREHEFGLLRERWEQSLQGVGQVVVLSGEMGIGKSRLVRVFQEHIAGEAYAQLACRCSPYYQHSALYPLIEWVQRELQWQRDDVPPVKLRKLEAVLESYDLVLTEAVPLLATLLSLPLPAPYASPHLPPQQQKQQTLAALLAWLLKKAEQPVCLVMEDLHWVDPSTLEFLDLLIEQVPTARLLVILTCRPDFVPSWVGRSHVTQMTLSRLSPPQTERMIERVTAGKALPAEVVQQLVAKTNGVPLFVEEVTKMILESGLVKEQDGHYALTGPLPSLAIPSTLQDSLMARLDRQGVGKLVAQLGATLGREFAYEVLQAISPLEESILLQGLARLVHAEILYQRGLPPQAQYVFKHVLIQEVAYQSMLRSTSQQYHRRIAQTLEARFPETRETQPELLAHHYTEAGLSAQAVVYWQQAGQRAIARSAHMEAIAHLQRGLAVSATLLDTPTRLQHELALHMALGMALAATRGYAAPAVEQAYLRARACCQQVGDLAQLFTVLHGLWLVYLVRGELRLAHEQGEHLLRLTRRQPEPPLLLQAHRAVGTSLFFLGELAAAWSHLEQGLALYEAPQHYALTMRYGQDPGLVCLVYAAWSLWLRGYPDQALDRIHQALALTQQCSHSFCQAFALTFAVMLHWFRRDTDAVAAQVEASLSLAYAHAFPLFVAMGRVFQGGVLAAHRPEVESLEQIRQGIVAYRETGTELFRPYFLGLLAEAYRRSGRTGTGLEVLTEALALVELTGERLYEADLYRLKGELLLAQDSTGQQLEAAEACLRHALEVARRQQARSLELRAAIRLSWLWQQQGKRHQARHLLAAVYGQFTEGFDTGDLQEAKTLLDEL